MKKGKTVWLVIVCVGLMSGSSAARLTGQLIIENLVQSVVNPVCGLAAYAGDDQGETVWRLILRELLTVPLPLISYAEETEMWETAVTDPVYDKYLSAEVLYNGGTPSDSLAVGGEALGQTGNGQDGQNSGNTGEHESSQGENSENMGEHESSQDTNSAESEEVSATIQTHLPDKITGSLYTLDQLNNFNYLVNQLYFVHSSTTVYPSQLNAEALLEKDLTIDKQTEGPQILIHHTHGTEDFADSVEGEGKTILEVGDYLTQLLEEYGYTVIHDRSIYPYDTAYSEAAAQVRQILQENPSIQVVIDLHRDATASMKRHVVELDGQTMAPLMFFNGMCQTPDGPIDYLNNPYLEDNLALSLQMKLLAEAYYPGLTRQNFLKAYQYNQHLLPRYTLVEAGFDTNTFDEVCRSMIPLAKILDAVLSDPDAVKLAGES